MYRNNDPYVVPTGSLHDTLVAGSDMYYDVEAVGATRYFYLLRALGCDGSTVAHLSLFPVQGRPYNQPVYGCAASQWALFFLE